jgi:hypothetical protein
MRRADRGTAVRTAVLLVIAAALGVPRGARAQTEPNAASSAAQTAIHLQYAAHEGCPDAIGFFGYVRARTTHLRTAAMGESADIAKIDIVREGTQSVGTLELPPVDARPFTRRVDASSCEEVVLALSLVLALAYDPDAITTFAAEVTAPAAPVPAAPVAAAPTFAQGSAPPPVSMEAAPSPPVPPARFGAAAGLAAYGSSGISPGASAQLAAFVEYGSNAERLWRPSGRVSLFFGIPERNLRPSQGGEAGLLFFGGQLSGCPLSLRITEGVSAVPCLGFDLGQIIGSGQGSADGDRTGSLWWIALEAIVRIRAVVTGPLFVELAGSGGVTLSPGRFQFVVQNQDVPIYKIPIGFGSFGIGLGVHLE